jgi:putative transposase
MNCTTGLLAIKYINSSINIPLMELRMYKYRLYPSSKQIIKLNKSFAHCKHVYNELLGLNKKLWTTNKYDFNDIILDLKICNPEISTEVHSQVLQNVSDRLSKAFSNFFNRVKMKKKGINVKVGFPRFKRRIASITYPQSGFKFLNNKRLEVSKIGSIPIVLHRIPRGKIKTLTIKQNSAGQWYAVLSCEVDFPVVEHPSDKVVGIDVGLENFLTDNKGISVANPRFYLNAERKLARLQRIHSKRVKGSKNREKARLKVAKRYLKVFNQRTDFLHKASTFLFKKYKVVCGERLNINNMIKGNLAKHILDASWGRFYNMLSYKAVTCGGELLKNPKTRGSSKRCSKCGTEVIMPLDKRKFLCPNCGLFVHRDKNSALNHVKDTVGLTGITPVEIPPLPPILVGVSGIVESGTINGI